MGRLNKKQVSDLVAMEQGIYKKDAEALVDTVFEVIFNELANKGEVNIQGFGRFHIRHHKATKRVMPNGTEVQVKAKDVPTLTFSDSLKEKM